MATGRPVETELGKKVRANKQIKMWPSTRGAKNWPHVAFNPDTGLLYANTMHVGMLCKHLESKPHVVGQRYMYIENLNMPRTAIRSVISKPSIRSPAKRNDVGRAGMFQVCHVRARQEPAMGINCLS